MSYTIDIGAAPANADCAQLGQTLDFDRVNGFEIDAYRIGIIAIHGLPPEGCRLTSKPNRHYFGTYRTLVLHIDDENDPAVAAYAEAVEDGLGSWIEAAIACPVEYDGNVANIPRPELDEVTIGALLTTRPDANGRFAMPASRASSSAAAPAGLNLRPSLTSSNCPRPRKGRGEGEGKDFPRQQEMQHVP